MPHILENMHISFKLTMEWKFTLFKWPKIKYNSLELTKLLLLLIEIFDCEYTLPLHTYCKSDDSSIGGERMKNRVVIIN